MEAPWNRIDVVYVATNSMPFYDSASIALVVLMHF
jgi:hypothetical protein